MLGLQRAAVGAYRGEDDPPRLADDHNHYLFDSYLLGDLLLLGEPGRKTEDHAGHPKFSVVAYLTTPGCMIGAFARSCWPPQDREEPECVLANPILLGHMHRGRR